MTSSVCGRIEAHALGEFDQHVDRIGAGQLGVELRARGHRLLAIGNLIGQAIARLQAEIDRPQAADEEQGEEAIEARSAHHMLGDPSAEAAQRVDAGVGARIFVAKTLSLRINKMPSTGTSDSTVTSATIMEMNPAWPKVRMRSESENIKPEKR